MSVHMKKHLISQDNSYIVRMIYHNEVYEVPLRIIEKYKVKLSTNDSESLLADDIFSELDQKFTKAGALIKGLRYREGLNQIEFAKKIKITQADLSKIETGKRPVGKIIAKRVAAKFGINYRSLLG